MIGENMAQDIGLQKENKLGSMPMFRLMMTVSIPMVISMIVQALYNVVDTLFVAQLSVEQYELTAISLSFAAQNFMIAVATGTGVGINALLSKSLGEKDNERANKIANNGLFLALCSYIVFLALGLFAVKPYMHLMTDDATVIELGKEYISICFLFSFGLFGEIAMERFMISTGKTHLAMCTQGLGAILNIALDPIFIFGLFGLPALGIRGAAVATVLGQIIAFLVSILLNAKFNKDIHLSIKGFRPDGKIIGRIYAIGVPSIIMASIGSLMNMMLNSILNSFVDIGRYAQNAFGAYFKLQSFVFMPVFGLNNGIVPIVAYNYGARKKKRMLSATFIGMALATGYMLSCLVLFELAPSLLLTPFVTEAQTMKIALVAMRVLALSFIFAGSAIIMGSVFQALGKSVFSMIISICRQIVVLIPLAYLFSLSGNVDLVWWSFPLAECASFILSVIFLIVVYKKIISQVKE